MTKEKVLLTGANGQLGSTFSNLFERSDLNVKYELQKVDIEDVDFTNIESICSVLSIYAPSIIVNCAAFTAVDKAEEEHDIASKVNDDAVAVMAKWAEEEQSRIIHISTDFVFDGSKKTPYMTTDATNPLGVYGKTKLSGEQHILKLLPDTGVIMRTSWLYSEFGQNFVKKMLALMVEKDKLSVVNDQVGSPTSTHSLVKILFKVIENKTASGIFHWCDGASISWYDFAVEIQEQSLEKGILLKKIPIRQIGTSAYPTLAERPEYSVLDINTTLNEFNTDEVNWKKELNRVIAVIATTD